MPSPRFVRHDLMTSDPASAAAFYSGLLGWPTEVMETEMGPMHVGLHGGQPFLAFIPFEHDEYPSHWMSYLSTDDLDASLEQVTELGGQVSVPAFQMGPVGRTAVINDPNGGTLHLLEPSADLPDRPAVGGVWWNELISTDAPTATPFYLGLTDWRQEDRDGPMGSTYHVLLDGDQMVAGAMTLPAEQQMSKVQWFQYWWTEDCDASAAKVAELGGQVAAPPFDVEGVGRISVCVDPTGAVFGLAEPAEEGDDEAE